VIELIEIHPDVWVDPLEVVGVYLRTLHSPKDETTVVLLNGHEIRLPGNVVTHIKELVTK